MQKERNWASEEPITELAGKTLVVAGTGAIGAKVAEFAQAFDMEIIGVNTTGHPVKPFSKTYAMSDIEKVAPLADFLLVFYLIQTKQQLFIPYHFSGK